LILRRESGPQLPTSRQSSRARTAEWLHGGMSFFRFRRVHRQRARCRSLVVARPPQSQKSQRAPCPPTKRQSVPNGYSAETTPRRRRDNAKHEQRDRRERVEVAIQTLARRR